MFFPLLSSSCKKVQIFIEVYELKIARHAYPELQQLQTFAK
jgi:hypothetical protein